MLLSSEVLSILLSSEVLSILIVVIAQLFLITVCIDCVENLKLLWSSEFYKCLVEKHILLKPIP